MYKDEHLSQLNQALCTQFFLLNNEMSNCTELSIAIARIGIIFCPLQCSVPMVQHR